MAVEFKQNGIGGTFADTAPSTVGDIYERAVEQHTFSIGIIFTFIVWKAAYH